MADIYIEMLVTAVAPKTADQYTCHITGSLISISVFLLARHKKYQQSEYGPLSGLLIELKKIISSPKWASAIHRKKINDPLGFIVLQTQLAFSIGSRNKQAILDSYQSEIFCYTMNPLMTKSREYKTKLVQSR